MNVACDYEAPMQMLTTEKYIAPRTLRTRFLHWQSLLVHLYELGVVHEFYGLACVPHGPTRINEQTNDYAQDATHHAILQSLINAVII